MAQPRELPAKAPHEGCEIADAGRQHRFDALAQPPRQHGRGAAGADGDNDLSAVDHGREDESGEVRPVNDVDRDVLAPRALRNLCIERTAARRNNGDELAKIHLQRIATGKLDFTSGDVLR